MYRGSKLLITIYTISLHASFHRDGYRHIVAYYQGILTDGLCKIFRWAHLEVHIGA